MLVFLWALWASPEQITMVCGMQKTGKQPWAWGWHLNEVAFWGPDSACGIWHHLWEMVSEWIALEDTWLVFAAWIVCWAVRKKTTHLVLGMFSSYYILIKHCRYQRRAHRNLPFLEQLAGRSQTRATGQRFGKPASPLLVFEQSCRFGANEGSIPLSLCLKWFCVFSVLTTTDVQCCPHHLGFGTADSCFLAFFLFKFKKYLARHGSTGL